MATASTRCDTSQRPVRLQAGSPAPPPPSSAAAMSGERASVRRSAGDRGNVGGGRPVGRHRDGRAVPHEAVGLDHVRGASARRQDGEQQENLGKPGEFHGVRGKMNTFLTKW